MKYNKTCWNCKGVVQGDDKDIKLCRDYYDESYMALVCPGCGAHATLLKEEEPKGWYWNYDKKLLIIPD